MATRKKQTTTAAPKPVVKTVKPRKRRWKSTKVFHARGFLRPDSLSAFRAGVEVSEMPYLAEGTKEVEAFISLRDGSDTIDLSFFAKDKKDASKELAQLDHLVKLVSATRDAYLKALAKAFG